MDLSGLLTDWIDILIANSVLAGAVFAVVFVATQLTRRRGPAIHVALWSLVLIRLVLPPGLGHAFAAGSLVERLVPRDVGTGSFTGLLGEEPGFLSTNTRNQTRVEVGGTVEPWPAAAAVLWLAGFTVAGAVHLRRLRVVRRVLDGAEPVVDTAVLAACDAWRHRLGVRRRVRVTTSASATTPFTAGVVRPLIYLPRAVIEDSRCMEAAMAHEMAHVARLDALWLGLQHILQAVYFFNPVVWITGSNLNASREQLCDATVVAAGRLAARDYVGGLLDVLRLELRRVSAPTMTARKRRIGVRILNIFELEGGRRPRVRTALVLTTVFGLFLLPLGSTGVDAVPLPPAIATGQESSDLTAAEQIKLANPLPEGRITWSWGPGHLDPFTHKEVLHRGIDLAAESGTPVIAPADGVVRVATEAYEPSPGSGTVIFIDHENGFATFFAHLESLTVIEGQRVEKGAVIATVGSTGKSTGPHLHFEVHRDGEAVDPAGFVEEWN